MPKGARVITHVPHECSGKDVLGLRKGQIGRQHWTRVDHFSVSVPCRTVVPFNVDLLSLCPKLVI